MKILDYTIDCTGDAVVGDEVCFERAIFIGSWRKPKFAGLEQITGKIVNESYGRDKQQHTFTLARVDGSKLVIKGRNLYRNGTHRKPWPDESKRGEVAAEKHQRGNRARTQRDHRRAYESFDWQAESLSDFEKRNNLQPA